MPAFAPWSVQSEPFDSLSEGITRASREGKPHGISGRRRGLEKFHAKEIQFELIPRALIATFSSFRVFFRKIEPRTRRPGLN
jgi:hypothetical protein